MKKIICTMMAAAAFLTFGVSDNAEAAAKHSETTVTVSTPQVTVSHTSEKHDKVEKHDKHDKNEKHDKVDKHDRHDDMRRHPAPPPPRHFRHGGPHHNPRH